MTFLWRKRPRVDDGEDGRDLPKPRLEKEGLFLLGESPGPGEPLVDIIAIHGVRGDPYDTWTDGGHLWLRDFLPHQVPNIRVMSFGYGSSVEFSKSTASIETFSLQLLGRLNDARETDQERSRPIIFVCHSLGGMVMKKALIIANERPSLYDNVLEKTRGAVFFGTPHQGSDVAYWAELLARMLREMQLRTATNTKFLTQLQRKSETLANISQQFVERITRLKILTFFETHQFSYMSCRIVDESSALLNHENEEARPIAANHETMCKFADRESQAYSQVWMPIKRMIKSIIEASDDDGSNRFAQTDEYQKCTAALLLTEPKDDYTSVCHSKGSRLGGTCEWIQDVDIYVNWAEASGWQLLLLIGEPGIGKTMIATYLVDELWERSERLDKVVFAYYFCENKDRNRRSGEAILRSLLLQILRQRPEFFPYIASDFKAQGVQLFSSPNSIYALWRIAMTIFMSSTNYTFVFVVDAYDECEEQSQATFLGLLHESFAAATDSRNVKILITSRRTRQISSIQSQDKPFLKSLKIDNALVNADLSKFIDARVGALAEYTDERKLSVATKLKSKANGTFLWVSLVIDELSDAGPSCSDEVLDQMPDRLVEVYDRILGQIKPKYLETIKNILLWVVYAFRPLKITELAIATRFSRRLRRNDLNSNNLARSGRQNSADGDPNVREEVKLTPAELRAELERFHLIRFDESSDDSIVYLIHQSVKDYLLEKGISTNILPSQELANFKIFQSCTDYLSLMAFEENDRPHSDMCEPLFEKHMFLEYACEYWSEHAHSSGNLVVQNTQWISGVFILDDLKREIFYDLFNSLDRGGYNRQSHMMTTLHVLALLGLPQLVDVLLHPAELQRQLHDVDWEGRTALHLAAAKGNVDMVKLLISKGLSANAEDDGGYTALLESCLKNQYEVAKYLLESGLNLGKAQNDCYSALLAAVEFGNLPLTELVLHYGCDTSFRGWDSKDALETAVDRGTPHMVLTLLAHGAEIFDHHIRHCREANKFTILWEHLNEKKLRQCSFHVALLCQAAELHHPVFNYILDFISHSACRRFKRHLYDALRESAIYLDAHMMNLLLKVWKKKLGGCPNLESLLMSATDGREKCFWYPTEKLNSKYANIVSILVGTGFNWNYRDEEDRSAISMAINRVNMPVIRLLLDHGAVVQDSDFKSFDWSCIFKSMRGSQWNDFLAFISDKGINPNVLESALMLCISHGHLEDVQRLLCAIACGQKFNPSHEHEAKETEAPNIVSFEDGFLRTRIKLSIGLNLRCSEVYVGERMFFKMFRVATRICREETELSHYWYDSSFYSYSDDVLELLHESAKSSGNHSRMHDEEVIALIDQERVSMAIALIQSGWAGFPPQETCSKAVCITTKQEDYRSTEFFFDLGATLNYQLDGKTALYIACDKRPPNPLFVPLLIRKGADVNAIGGLYGCPLGAAVRSGHLYAVQTLLEHGADVDGPCNSSTDFETPLVGALRFRYFDVALLLTLAGANVNAPSPNGPPLMLCSGNPKAVKYLLDKEADCRQTNQKGQTPLHLAVQKGYEDTVILLLEAGANPDTKDRSGTSARDIANQPKLNSISGAEDRSGMSASKFVNQRIRKRIRELFSKVPFQDQVR